MTTDPIQLDGEVLLSAHCELGEAPIWDPQTAQLYWLDIPAARLHRWAYGQREWETRQLERSASAIALGGAGLLLAVEDTLVYTNRDGTAFRSVVKLPEAPHNWRFNDGKADRSGRFWAGTIDPQRLPHNALFRYDGTLAQMDSGYRAANGIAWSPDNRLMYVVDSPTRTIYAYDYDQVTGVIANRRIFASKPDVAAVPDGITVDRAGGVWCAWWNGWAVTRFDADGNLTHQISLPVQFPTSCIFGGPDLNELFITSSWMRIPPELRKDQPLAGGVFRTRTPFSGMPEPHVAF